MPSSIEESTLNTPAEASSATASDTSTSTPATVEKSTVQTDDKSSTATSSDAGDPKTDVKKGTLLDALKDVVSKDKPEPSTEGQDREATKEPIKSEDPDKSKLEKNPEDDSRFDKHPRWQQMLKKVDAFEKDATEYRQVDAFMKSNNLSVQEVHEGFQIMAAMKNNPAQAHRMLSRYMDTLNEFVGEKLPGDINQRVQQGLVDMETAKELARTRNGQLFNEQRLREQGMARTAEMQHQQAQQFQGQITQAVSKWEEGIKTRDVDFAAKHPFVLDRIRSLSMGQSPRNEQEAVAIVQRAYDDVSQNMASLMPARKPMNPVTSEVSSASTLTRPVAKTLKEAVAQAIR